MRNFVLGAMTAAALVGVAACNRGEAPPANQAVSDSGGEGGVAETIRNRQAAFKEMGKASKAIGDQLKAGSPSLPAIQAAAQQLSTYAPQILEWFPAGSGPESGIRTRAKADVWSNQEGFGNAAANFIAEAETFKAVANTGDLAAIRAAQPALGNACRNCHDRFRAPEDE